MNRGRSLGIAAVAGAVLGAAAPASAEPVALVEEVIGAPAGVAFMDYLAPGKVIQLGAKDGLVVDYLGSCQRETIAGGAVTIGTERSKVAGGSIKREKVQCDGGKLNLSTEQAAQSGVVVFRGKPGAAADVKPTRILYGLSPLLDLEGGGHLTVERLDRPGERFELDIPATQLLRGSFYDFAKHGRSLDPGGVYRASANGRSVVFQIDAEARPGAAPLAGRLLRL